MVRLKCNGCGRVIEEEKKPFRKLTCNKCEGKFKVTDEFEPLSKGSKDEQNEESKEEEEELDSAFCPFCMENIDEIIQKSLKINDSSCELACCPKCNKILGVMEF